MARNKVTRNPAGTVEILIEGQRLMPYEEFIKMAAFDIAVQVRELCMKPDEMSFSEASREFGRQDVLRWEKSGQLQPLRVSVGKKKYAYADLKRLSRIKQNYLIK